MPGGDVLYAILRNVVALRGALMKYKPDILSASMKYGIIENRGGEKHISIVKRRAFKIKLRLQNLEAATKNERQFKANLGGKRRQK